MKILVIGLDCAAPEPLLGMPGLTNIRRLMDLGCYGRLESVVPPVTVPAWMCMSTSRDPGSLGIYGFRNRTDHSYGASGIVDSTSFGDLAIWDQVAREGKRANVIGVPPNYPARQVNGISVGCFLTPDTSRPEFAWPQHVGLEIAQRIGNYPVDVNGFRTDRKAWLRDQVFAMTAKHFALVRHFLAKSEWDYFQFVEIGLDRIQHGFWKHYDPSHCQYAAGSELAHVIPEYYQYLDEQIGSLLDLLPKRLDEECAVLVLSAHGAQRLDGGFCINEWLVQRGDLVLNRYPEAVTPFDQLDVHWAKTRAWSEGGNCARVYLNVKGREPEGTIDRGDYETVRDALQARLEALTDEYGEPLGNQVFRPEEVYREVHGVAPDLLVYFGGLDWRSIGGVGYNGLHQQHIDTGPDDCNHAQYGAFILAAPSCPLSGELEGVHLLDMAPTLLELGGYDVPSSMQGRSLVAGGSGGSLQPVLCGSDSDEELVRQRLSGLGYI